MTREAYASVQGRRGSGAVLLLGWESPARDTGRSSEPSQDTEAILRDGVPDQAASMQVVRSKGILDKFWKKSQQNLLMDMMWGMGKRQESRLTPELRAARKRRGLLLRRGGEAGCFSFRGVLFGALEMDGI